MVARGDERGHQREHGGLEAVGVALFFVVFGGLGWSDLGGTTRSDRLARNTYTCVYARTWKGRPFSRIVSRRASFRACSSATAEGGGRAISARGPRKRRRVERRASAVAAMPTCACSASFTCVCVCAGFGLLLGGR